MLSGALLTGLAAILVAAPALTAPSAKRARPAVAALQVALHARGLYEGRIDGLSGARTTAAIRAFQRRAGLRTTGRFDRRTRLKLGALGRPLPGKRMLGLGMAGWDVSVLEFQLASLGFPPGVIDGRFDGDTRAAVQRFQRYARLPDHCVVDGATFKSLGRTKGASARMSLDWPLEGKVVRRFGLQGQRLQAGIEIAAPYGTGIAAARDGRVAWADRQAGGLGLVVRIVHGRGVESVYGHLSRIDVKVGQQVVRGAWIGLAGRTGNAAAPRLYFEVRVRGAAVNPLAVLG